MGCNAWNHPPDCECGWGGVFHGHGADISQALAWPLKNGSWINPNAHCPICGAQVFFYKSPTGGSVYFDALGPPWPKHPCIQSRDEIPDSIFWKAQAVFFRWHQAVTRHGGPSVLYLSRPKFVDWIFEHGFMHSIRNNRYPCIVAYWVISLPYAVVGCENLDFHGLKKPTVVDLAQRIVGHFEKHAPRGLDQKVSLKVAHAVLDAYITPRVGTRIHG